MIDPELERDMEILEGQVALARVVPAAHVAVPLDRLERLMKAAVGDGAMKISDARMDELTRLARNASPIASEGYFWCSGCQKNVRGRHRCPGVRRTR